jgi:hypothetical protein
MNVIEWLLDSDPAIRWQVKRDLLHAPSDEVAAERARVADEGWGARMLALRGEDGLWAGGAHFPSDFRGDFSDGQPWTATNFSLQFLRSLGVDPDLPRVREAVASVAANARWEHAGQRYFDGEVEPCINGMTLAVGSYFGQDVDGIAERLVGERLSDGGWNCGTEYGSVVSSFDTTISVLEGLLAYERARGPRPDVTAAREGGHEYLLARRLMFGLRSGEIADPHFAEFSYPPRWHYDVLRALDYFRDADAPLDPRMDEALDLVESKRGADGRWLLENTHRGATHFEMEEVDGKPSRWNTLRALRVLAWAGRATP